MRDHSFISNIEALKRWFELNQGKESRPYFTIYRGYETKPDRIILRNTEISEPERAWELMEEVLDAHADGGGQFRVYVTDKPGHNVGMSTLVRLPNPNQAANIAGIGGASGNFGIYGSFKEALETELARERRMWELEQEIEAMKAGQAGMNGVEQVRQIFEAVPALNPLAHALGMKLMGMAPAQLPPPQQNAPGAHAPGEAIAGADNDEGYDYDVVEPALDKMRRVFPDVEMTLDKMADWIAKNPEMARNLFGNIQNPA